MKLKDAMVMAYICGLSTMRETYLNIEHHAMNLFKYEEINEQLTELWDDIKKWDCDPDDYLADVADKMGLEWYYKTDEDKMYGAASLREKDGPDNNIGEPAPKPPKRN